DGYNGGLELSPWAQMLQGPLVYPENGVGDGMCGTAPAEDRTLMNLRLTRALRRAVEETVSHSQWTQPPHFTDITRPAADIIPAALLLMDRTAAVPRQPEMRRVELQLKRTVAGDRFNEHSPTTLRHAGAQRAIRPERKEGHQNEAGDVWLFN
ncbi:hypothetical protein IRJ41_020450, partial [Triplophysa rosa]